MSTHPLSRTLLKVCGATTPHDIEAAAAAGADCVGLWHGVPGGPSELEPNAVAALAAAARSAGLLPVLVTFLSDAAALAHLVRATGAGWVQLHAYQPPATVRALREALPPDVGIVKVLHVQEDGSCVERPLIGAYDRAGTDLFLLDTATGDGRIGSTGRTLDPARLAALLPRLTRPFLLAGGLTPAHRPAYEDIVRHPGYRGIDVDTAARDHTTGAFGTPEITALARAWRTATAPTPDHPPLELSR
ncbi:phosphoribosylanthranilate isomerase [Streptomyces antarcticus]|uniref:phosphoribosylanthranilate isomerase n=1 Tax=Streptomyces antarcticus TaxID=2996458 RepID=UPI002271217C|nr:MULTISPECIES: N-(5'-phosphoribosyl)anthranilate isomerase [unclassified Streptomyces]MCY0947681.1 N-(5'-phosphoribosyl)anthranilate isomerase [Streptomyces sp. H34-AA3]MCZ4087825.1 N-(5'-phosphoribosyl)anthranilate isomerase [Streptomyces sp. H34-S5]